MYASYRDIPRLIENKEEFTGNSVRAVWDADGNYRVYSYNSIMLIVGVDDNVIVWDGAYYSRTTSRLQRIIRGIYPSLRGVEYYLYNLDNVA